MSLRNVILAGAFLAWGCTSNDNNGAGAAGASTGSGGTTSATAGGSAGSGPAMPGSGGTLAQGSGGSGATGTGGTGTGGSGGATTGGTGAGGAAAGGSAAGGTAGLGTSGTAGMGLGGNGVGGSGLGGAPAGGSGPMGGAGGATGAVTVALDSTHQTIEGFGINDNWQPAAFTSDIADSLFTTTKGIGLTILRIGMSDSGGLYNNYESQNISAVKSRAGTDAKIIGSVWTPPANCKTNGDVNDGGHLCSASNASTPNNKCSSNANSTCYDTYSTSIANFAKSNGLYAMSIGNEPDFASCGLADPCNGNYPTTLYTANEMVAFVKVAGPKLQQAGIKVIAPEASEWNHTWSNVSAGPDVAGKNSSDPLQCGFPPTSKCDDGSGYDYGHWLAKDATAWAAFDILGVHEYDSQQAYPWPSDVTAAKKEVWQTEMSGVKWWPEQGSGSGDSLKGTTTIDNGVAVAEWIHSALVVGDASAWLWWWYQPLSGGTNDNEGLILVDGKTDTKRHYTLGNYSKFVRPGYVRVDVTGAVPDSVLLSAYKGTDGTVAIVAINKSNAAVELPITIAGGTVPGSLTPNVTSAMDNLKAGSPVTVTGDTFTAMLGAMTVTTFVGK